MADWNAATGGGAVSVSGNRHATAASRIAASTSPMAARGTPWRPSSGDVSRSVGTVKIIPHPGYPADRMGISTYR